MNYYICLAVEGDMAALPREEITGMEELAALYFEQYGRVRKVTVYPFEPKPPKQLSFKDVVKTREEAEEQLRQKKARKKSPAKAAASPPELSEVLAYAAERRALGKGMTAEDAEQWYFSRDRGGWLYGDPPKPIRQWKSDFCVCERNITKQRAKETKTTGYATSFDLEAWERSTYEVPVLKTNEQRGF